MKKWLDGKRSTSNEKIIAETKAYFKGFNKIYVSDWLKKLEYRWIQLEEDYKEKTNFI